MTPRKANDDIRMNLNALWKQATILRFARNALCTGYSTGNRKMILHLSEGSASEEVGSNLSFSVAFKCSSLQSQPRMFNVNSESSMNKWWTSGLSHDSKNNFTFRGNWRDLSRLSVNFSPRLSDILLRSPLVCSPLKESRQNERRKKEPRSPEYRHRAKWKTKSKCTQANVNPRISTNYEHLATCKQSFRNFSKTFTIYPSIGKNPLEFLR